MASDAFFQTPSEFGGANGRTGCLLGCQTPTFTLQSSRGFPLHLRPEIVNSTVGTPNLLQIPLSDILLRKTVLSENPASAEGCAGFWPHVKNQVSYCSFRDPKRSQSVFGGDNTCNLESFSGRLKAGPQELIEAQKAARAQVVCAPAEEVPLDGGNRRSARSVKKAGEWLEELLNAKATDSTLDFEWHLLAGIQGGGDVALRAKACQQAASKPVAGFWIGGLGYAESLSERARVLDTVGKELPPKFPRFLPLSKGTPIEVLQAVLLGIDVVEVTFPHEIANKGIALTFSWEMPQDWKSTEEDQAALAGICPDFPDDSSAARAISDIQARQSDVTTPECKENFESITANSPVKQYSKAYLHHLFGLHELLGTMLLTQHNLHVYQKFFSAIRFHIEANTMRQFAAWFIRTQIEPAQTSDQSTSHKSGPDPKRRKT